MEYVRQLETQNQSMKAELATLRDRLRQAAVAQEELRTYGNRRIDHTSQGASN